MIFLSKMTKNIGLIILCGIFSLSFAMDSQMKKKRIAFIVGDPTNDSNWYTYNNLADVIAPPFFEFTEQYIAALHGGKTIDMTFQKDLYDTRNAGLAADLILHGVSLKDNAGDSLTVYLPLLQKPTFRRMANVLAFGFLVQTIPPSTYSANDPCWTFKFGAYCAALEGLKLAYEEGKNLIKVDDYVHAVNADGFSIQTSDALRHYDHQGNLIGQSSRPK